MRFVKAVVLGSSAALLLAGAPAPPTAGPLCGPSDLQLRPSADLYCLELIPRPDVPQTRAMLELGRAESPYDVAVTAAGNQR